MSVFVFQNFASFCSTFVLLCVLLSCLTVYAFLCYDECIVFVYLPVSFGLNILEYSMRFHINPDSGRPNLCDTQKRSCKFAVDGDEPPHYESKVAARESLSGSRGEVSQGVSETVENDENSTVEVSDAFAGSALSGHPFVGVSVLTDEIAEQISAVALRDVLDDVEAAAPADVLRVFLERRESYRGVPVGSAVKAYDKEYETVLRRIVRKRS